MGVTTYDSPFLSLGGCQEPSRDSWLNGVSKDKRDNLVVFQEFVERLLHHAAVLRHTQGPICPCHLPSRALKRPSCSDHLLLPPQVDLPRLTS